MAITESGVKAGEARMRKRQTETGAAVSARYDRRTRRVVVALNSGIEFSFATDQAQGLAGASAVDLSAIEITPSGLGLHWPRLDADLYVPALLQGVFGSKTWMASLMGKTGGQARTKAKTAAARENGKKGGRPRKTQPA